MHPTTRLRTSLIALFAAALFLFAPPYHAAEASTPAGRVFLDPGHGGRWPGAVYGGIREADLALVYALEIQRNLRVQGHSTMLSRTSNVNVGNVDIPTWSTSGTYAAVGGFTLADDLQARCNLANAWGADVFVSIHANAAVSSAANGAETFWRNTGSMTDRQLSRRLADLIQQEYILETGLVDRGVKEDSFYVLRWSNMPAVLVETGFMSNPTELQRLINPTFQRDASAAVARGIDRFLRSNPFRSIYPRLAGSDRFATAAAVAGSRWPTTAETVILASGADWPDAMVGSTLSRRMNAPMLLVGGDAITEETRARIARLRPSRIVVLGGEAAVSPGAVNSAVSATGRAAGSVTVERIAGDDRFSTAAQIATRVGVPADGRVFVVSGANFPDALSVGSYAGALGAPILLADRGVIPTETLSLLTANNTAIQRIEVIGGTGAIGPEIEAQLRTFGTVRRIAGADRFRTNVAVIRAFMGTAAVSPLVANADAFPDALSASTIAAAGSRPVVLVRQRNLPAPTREFLFHHRSRLTTPTVVGGTGAVSSQMEWMIQKGFGR
ncbi:MAG: cell wall-binding repeat-containing protein [Actinobacteria bacterium]|nr:cell wall-binding repeat-containing protein [Actinomycetota bacterium]MCL5887122.1 cell wall-binding repeat-containing protein [Actinomycetota bacterium]